MGDCRAVVGIDKELFLEDISVVYNEGRPVLRPEKKPSSSIFRIDSELFFLVPARVLVWCTE